uniref:7TM_GPCR_Srx domain-containing protein n=1 Tax=Panagrellus redivivus TaxID=6233 RepID=A0A7E4ZQ50_PANRE
MYVMSFLFIVRPIVQTTEVIFICADGENNNALLYIHCVRDMAVIGIRFIWLEVGVERIIATVYVGTYEKSMMMFSVIRNKNKTFRQLSNLTGERALKLTEKYQIIENIRSMDYLIPHSNIDAVTDLITVVASFFGRYFYDRIGSAAIYNFVRIKYPNGRIRYLLDQKEPKTPKTAQTIPRQGRRPLNDQCFSVRGIRPQKRRAFCEESAG